MANCMFFYLVKCNYKIYNKQIISIIQYYEAWRLEQEKSVFHIYILSDYKNLEYLITTKTLSC